MDWSLFVLALGAIGLVVWILAERRKTQARAQSGGHAPPPHSGGVAKPQETTAQALHRLAGAIEQFVENSAHPRELIEQPDFKAATTLLGQKDVSFDLIRQYATGASWTLACAALHVLKARPERDSLSQTVLLQLKQMRPWTIYFALNYFASLEQRPPVGAPAA